MGIISKPLKALGAVWKLHFCVLFTSFPRFLYHSGPEYRKKSRKIDFTSFFMHKNFVKSNFKAKLQSLCSKNLQNMSKKIRYSAFSREFAQMRPLLQDSTQNLMFIRV